MYQRSRTLFLGISLIASSVIAAPGQLIPPSPEMQAKYRAAAQETIEQACAPIDAKALGPLSEREYLAGYLSIYLGMDNSMVPGVVDNLDVAKSIFERWSDLSCVQADGQPRLAIFEYAVQKTFGFGPMRGYGPMTPELAMKRMGQIRERFPNTLFATLVEAEFWKDAAWDARGGGFTGSVSAAGSNLFEEDLAKANKILTDKKAIVAESPVYYELLLSIEGSEGGLSPRLISTFKEGAQRFKSYGPIYIRTLNFSQGKWGGSADDIDHMINWSVDNTKDSTGQWMYARLYGYLEQFLDPQESIFKTTSVSWPRMKTGYQDHLKQIPSDHFQHNLFARFACEAGDGPTFLTERKKLGAQIDADAWNGPLSLEVCDAKFKFHG